jgi:hypothetical protein
VQERPNAGQERGHSHARPCGWPLRPLGPQAIRHRPRIARARFARRNSVAASRMRGASGITHRAKGPSKHQEMETLGQNRHALGVTCFGASDAGHVTLLGSTGAVSTHDRMNEAQCAAAHHHRVRRCLSS